MGDLIYKQQLAVRVQRKPAQQGAPITETDFEIDPAENLTVEDFNEDNSIRYNVPDGTVDQSVGLGTVALAKVLIIKPDQDTKMKVVNSEGTSQLMLFKGGRTSVLHVEATDILITNDTGNAVKGKIFIAGE